jgi:hypothetical protein
MSGPKSATDEWSYPKTCPLRVVRLGRTLTMLTSADDGGSSSSTHAYPFHRRSKQDESSPQAVESRCELVTTTSGLSRVVRLQSASMVSSLHALVVVEYRLNVVLRSGSDISQSTGRDRVEAVCTTSSTALTAIREEADKNKVERDFEHTDTSNGADRAVISKDSLEGNGAGRSQITSLIKASPVHGKHLRVKTAADLSID